MAFKEIVIVLGIICLGSGTANVIGFDARLVELQGIEHYGGKSSVIDNPTSAPPAAQPDFDE